MAVALGPVLVWLLFSVILIAMGAILFAVVLTLVAEPLTRRLEFPRAIALVISGLVIITVVGAAGYLFATRVAAQLQEVLQLASQAVDNIRGVLQSSDFGKLVVSHVEGGSFSLTNVVTGVFSVTLTFLTGLVIAVFGGIYLAPRSRFIAMA